MPRVPSHLRARARDGGGVVGYPLDLLGEEVAYVAYHFHWPHGEIMALEHADRRRWVQQISGINQRMSEE